MNQVTVSTALVDEAQNELVRSTLRAQRARLSALLHGFNEDEWGARSRCREWNVHEVVRHLSDANLRCIQLLRGEAPDGVEGFDPRTTPVAWLANSATERPHETLRRFEDSSAELLDEVDRHIRDRTGARLPFLYGPVPWSVAVLHVVWDAWVHERDIVLPVRRPHDSPAVESRAVAAYGLAVAGCLSVMFQGTSVDESFDLAGDGGGAFRLVAGHGPGAGQQFTVTACADADLDAEPLRGDLADVVDSLVGREGDLVETLHGPPERVERLGTMRGLMLLPTS